SAIRPMGFNLLQSGPSAIFGSVVGSIAPVQTAGTVPPATFANNGVTMGGGGSGGGSTQSGLITGGAINSAPGFANLFLGVVTKSASVFGFLEALRTEGWATLVKEPLLVTSRGQPASVLSG